jgi:peptidoglycan/xylan/chitin deacetylase (PgdA/CDA1 family)
MMASSRSRWRAKAAHLIPRALLLERGSPAARRVALTFDDGPDEHTLEYLELLDRHRVRATFFLVGEMCHKHHAAMLEIVRRGHQVAGHGFTHREFPTLSSRELRDELGRTAAVLPLLAGGRALVRPPRGRVSPRSLAVCGAAGFQTVMWSLDSDDCRTKDPEVVAARVAPERVRAGEIVLLHEGQSWTLAALPQIIEGLRGAGFELCTVGELGA